MEENLQQLTIALWWRLQLSHIYSQFDFLKLYDKLCLSKGEYFDKQASGRADTPQENEEEIDKELAAAGTEKYNKKKEQ